MIYGPGADHWETPAELFTAPRATNPSNTGEPS